MYKMLYYPFVHPPQETLYEAALYWDGLTTLVPDSNDFYRPFDKLNSLRQLRDAGLYEPTNLSEALTSSDHEDLIDSIEAGLRSTQSRPQIPAQLDRYSRLWHGKIPHLLEQEAQKRGWMIVDHSNPAAFRGDPNLLLGMISALTDQVAEDLAGHDRRIRYVPTTTSEFAHLCATAPTTTSGVRQSWMVDIGPALPVPPRGTPLSAVLQFRDKYADERHRCLEAVRELQGELQRTVVNPHELELELRGRLAEAAADLQGAAKSTFKGLASRVVMLSVASALPLLATHAAPGAAGLAAASVLAVGGGWLTNIASAPIKRNDRSFSYLHQYERTFGVE